MYIDLLICLKLTLVYVISHEHSKILWKNILSHDQFNWEVRISEFPFSNVPNSSSKLFNCEMMSLMYTYLHGVDVRRFVQVKKDDTHDKDFFSFANILSVEQKNLYWVTQRRFRRLPFFKITSFVYRCEKTFLL